MIENLINEAALLAIRQNSDKITEEHIKKAYLQILAGVEKEDYDNGIQKPLHHIMKQDMHLFQDICCLKIKLFEFL
jgi:cell division protease FtsH